MADSAHSAQLQIIDSRVEAAVAQLAAAYPVPAPFMEWARSWRQGGNAAAHALIARLHLDRPARFRSRPARPASMAEAMIDVLDKAFDAIAAHGSSEQECDLVHWQDAGLEVGPIWAGR